MKITEPEMERPVLSDGQMLTLRFDYWKQGFESGAKVKALSVRKDRKCRSGFRITVLIGDVAVGLDASWFKDYAL